VSLLQRLSFRLSFLSETHLPSVRPENTEYLQVSGHVPQLLHKGTERWDSVPPPCSNGLNSDVL